jgi:predicted phage terminase large subunit-like protein
MPSAAYIGASYSGTLSVDLSRKNRNIIKSEKYRRCFPEIHLQWDQDAKSHFVNTLRGERIAVGTGGVTGRHGHVIGIDDPLNPNEALSEAKLKSANTWIKETLFNRKKSAAVTPIILIMQRLHQDDPTANLLATGNPIRHICLPAQLSDKIKPKELAQCYVDNLLDPVRLSKEVLLQYEKTLQGYGFAGQYAQWPVPLGGGLFKYERILLDAPPTEFKRIIRFWDKAGTQGGGCFTVGAKLAEDFDGRFWILDIVRGQWDSGARKIIIKQIANMDTKSIEIGVEQEPGSGGKESAENTVKDLSGWIVHVDKPSGSESSKVLRAEPFSSQVNIRNVFMAPGEWNKPLLDELQFFPYSKYKDQVDALSGAFNILTKPKLNVGAF